MSKIKPVSVPEYDKHLYNTEWESKHIPEMLPKNYFNIVLFGLTKSGKTTVVNHLIYNIYKNIFDRIFYFSRNVETDSSLYNIKNDDEIIKVTTDLENINTIVKAIVFLKENDEKEKDKKYLLVYDDLLSYLSNKDNFVNRFVAESRHKKISQIFLLQDFKSLHKNIRNNCTAYLIWKVNSDLEREKVTKDLSRINKTEFISYLEYCTKEPYQFMYVLKNYNGRYEIWKNFDELIYEYK